jgi:hypothetical protein
MVSNYQSRASLRHQHGQCKTICKPTSASFDDCAYAPTRASSFLSAAQHITSATCLSSLSPLLASPALASFKLRPHRLSAGDHNPTCRRLRALTHPSPLSLAPATLTTQSWAFGLLAVGFSASVVGYILSVTIPRRNGGAPLTGHQYRPSHKPLRKRYVELPIPQPSLPI